MFVPTMKCEIPIWLNLPCKLALIVNHTGQNMIQECFFHFFDGRHCHITIFCKHFTFRSFHCFSREMKRDLIPSHSSDKLLCNLHLIWKLIIVFLPEPLFSPKCHIFLKTGWSLGNIFPPANHNSQRERDGVVRFYHVLIVALNWAVVGQPAGIARRNSNKSRVTDQ